MAVVDRLTKLAHFILVKSTNLASEVTHVFIREIGRLHGIPKDTVLEKYAKFTSRFWKELFVGLCFHLEKMDFYPSHSHSLGLYKKSRCFSLRCEHFILSSVIMWSQ